MKKHGIGSRLLALLLVMAMVLPGMPLTALAVVGDTRETSTGLTGDVDANDVISLPIQIFDYEADGMLFEFAESVSTKTAWDFGAAWVDNFGTTDFDEKGNFWDNVSVTNNTTADGKASWVWLVWAKNESDAWRNNHAGVLLSDFKNTSSDGTTANDADGKLDFSQIRYVTLVYRSNVTQDRIGLSVNDSVVAGAGSSGNQAWFDFSLSGDDGGGSVWRNWTYAVYDLAAGGIVNQNRTTGIYASLPLDGTDDWIDIHCVAYFPTEAQAKAFGEYELTVGSDRGDNRGFGLLRSTRHQDGSNVIVGVASDGSPAYSTTYQINTFNKESVDMSTITNLGYKLLGTFDVNSIANVGLLESAIGPNGYPVYKQSVVEYVANLLQEALQITERNDTADNEADHGWRNYRYIRGTASEIYDNVDLATALRSRIGKNGLGSYADSVNKNLVGTWDQVNGNISTYMDAAYFLLNSIFVAGSYNKVQTDYDYLMLSAATDEETGDKVYVFDGGFSNSAGSSTVAYDASNGTIRNTTGSTSKKQYSYAYVSSSNTDSWTTYYPFLPIISRNNASGYTKNPYVQDDGVINTVKGQDQGDTLKNRNYGFAMALEGEFAYYANDELFFEFEGDDDVYLFINGELVLDLGSAHSIDGYRFYLNDYVEAAKAGTLGSDARNKALSLAEGNTYSFQFYYLERHSYGSNIRIVTNIRVTDPAMSTDKKAYQLGEEINYAGVVEKDKLIEYGFTIENTGDQNLFDLTFLDTDIGIQMDYTSGLTVTGSRVYDANGGTLDVTDLVATVEHPNYSTITVTFDNNEEFKKFLEDLSADGTENETGLYVDASVTIRGFYYRLSDAQIKEGKFDNTLVTTSDNRHGKTLNGSDNMLVFVPSDPMYYQWAGHELYVTKEKLIGDITAAAAAGGALEGKVPGLTASNVTQIELTSISGRPITNAYMTFDGSYNLTINNQDTGSWLNYLKITYNNNGTQSVVVPLLVNVTDVKDSVFVLDYGLSVDLSDGDELIKNDSVKVPGRDTEYGIIAVGDNGSYSPNEISFSKASGEAYAAADGTFSLSNGKLTYTPTDFMEGLDTIQIAMNVYEVGTTPSNIDGTLNINKEVEMYKNITVLPANVVYYEDDFPAITYTNTNNTITKIGSSSGKTQSNNQDEQYGYDDTYYGDTEDAYSGGSLTKITIKESGVNAQFTFKGTGFELIGRTNATDSATLKVKVLDEEGTTVQTIPVVTEFDNGNGSDEIYQVPVVRVKDLAYGTYTVQISGVPARDYTAEKGDDGKYPIKETILYIDGLRIYQSLGGEGQNGEENYIESEQEAQFLELRDQIIAGAVAVVSYDEEDDGSLNISTDTLTWTENRKGEVYEGNSVESVEDYLLTGPNNEVYMDGTSEYAAMVFYVKKTDEADTKALLDGTGLQVAFRAIDDALFSAGMEGGACATVSLGTYDAQTGKYGWKTLAEDMTSSTEQYFVIDYTQCFYDQSKDAYQIVLVVESGMVSFSSLKLSGLELVSVNGDATDLYYVDGVLCTGFETTDDEGNTVMEYTPVDEGAYVNFNSVSQQMATLSLEEEPSEPDETIPDETEPEETEPEETEPEETVPEETQPEETVPEETEPEEIIPSKPSNNREDMLKKILQWIRGWGCP